MTGKNYRLAVILINWNSAETTLRSVSLVSSWSGISVQVIVVDNGSSRNDLTILENSPLPLILIRNNINLGYSGGNNVGITWALNEDFQYIMLLNTDVIMDGQCTVKLLKCLDNSPGIGVIGPLLQEEGCIHSGGRNIGVYSRTRIRYKPDNGTSGLINVDYVPGTVFLVRKDVFGKIGLLDEDFFFSGEIADFCRRLNSAGLMCAIFCECQAMHTPDVCSKTRDLVHNYYNIRNRFLYIRKYYHYSRLFFTLRWIAGGGEQILLALITGRRERARALWLGLRDGCSGRFGNRNDHFLL